MVCMPLKTFKKSLKIPKGYQNTSIEGQTAQSEYVNRRTDSTMAKRKKKEKDKHLSKNIHIKLKIE